MRVRVRYAFPYPGKVAKILSGLVRDVLGDVRELSQEDEVRKGSPRDSRDERRRQRDRS